MLVRTWLALAAHYGEYMLHPVAVTPAMFLTTDSIVVVRLAKNSASVTPSNM